MYTLNSAQAQQLANQFGTPLYVFDLQELYARVNLLRQAYPERVELYAGPDREHLELLDIREPPQGPGRREIEKLDVAFGVHRTLGAFRIVARRYEKMPQWCAYRGSENVFTMADSLIVTPEE